MPEKGPEFINPNQLKELKKEVGDINPEDMWEKGSEEEENNENENEEETEEEKEENEEDVEEKNERREKNEGEKIEELKKAIKIAYQHKGSSIPVFWVGDSSDVRSGRFESGEIDLNSGEYKYFYSWKGDRGRGINPSEDKKVVPLPDVFFVIEKGETILHYKDGSGQEKEVRL